MKDERDWEGENFEHLLAWLDPDRERAGARYEEIRRALIKIFASRGCPDPEDLADETLARVCRKVRTLTPTYFGDPAKYFYGVAQHVHLESLRRTRRRAERLKLVEDSLRGEARARDSEREYDCLEACLAELPAASRQLVLEYYRDAGAARIARRARLAERFGVGAGALRLRAFRLRAALERCVRARLDAETPGRGETDRGRRQ
ncbi:MAG: hypothetical protein LC800_16230 [Acidobacteria bacterium]|nr:hypothetical protein [Acidobacteriota bacterium]